jgi:hypothetical protein
LGLNKQRANYDQARQALISQLQRYPHIKDPGLDSVWFLQHDGTPDALSNDIQTKLDRNDRMIVIKLVTRQHQGWLGKNVWDWINAR